MGGLFEIDSQRGGKYCLHNAREAYVLKEEGGGGGERGFVLFEVGGGGSFDSTVCGNKLIPHQARAAGGGWTGGENIILISFKTTN